ncbi:MAG: amidohydrolase family protein [Gammaproteobacteria bacterium]
MARVLALMLLLAASAAPAQPRIALVDGLLIDGMSAQPVPRSVILIEGDRIVAVGDHASLPVPAGYETISLKGMSVLPGLWENHAHLMLNGHSDYAHWHPTYADRLGDEIMPASAYQLLMAGVTTARDLGAPLEESLSVRSRIESGELVGPRLFVSGPFIQHRAYPGTESYRWGINGVRDARAKVERLAKAGVDIIKLVDQDLMTLEVAQAVVDTAHKHGLVVVAHSHRPAEIRRGLEIGVDNFEHTGLTSAPEYPPDVIAALRERTAAGMITGGPLYWTPTVEGLWNYDYVVARGQYLFNDCWHAGLAADTIADIEESIQRPERLPYYQMTPLRKPTLPRKIAQLREAGVVMLIGTDAGIPLKFHCRATWNELDVWVNVMDIPVMDAIRGATYWPALLMGVADQWGTLTPGKYADIIAVRGDVLRHVNVLEGVDFVMKGGHVYKRDGRPTVEPPVP